jgi:hypothetical protein
MKVTRAIYLAVSFLSGILLASGCASGSNQGPNVYPEPRSDKALVYFFREWRSFGGGVSYNVRERGEVIGRLPNASYFTIFADPGRHIYSGDEDAKDDPIRRLEAGKTYYIKCSPRGTHSGSRLALELVEEAAAQALLPRLRCVTK